MANTKISSIGVKASQPVRATPLPRAQLTILCIILLTESICSTVLIPFVGLYIAFLMNLSTDSTGYYTGTLIGLFMLGQVISSRVWSYVSDHYGRKFSITLGVMLCAVAMFFFGLSTSFWSCCVWRFIHGLSSGCSLVAKTMIADVTDRTNQNKGFALVSLTWGIGTLFGPAIGGFFYDPVHNSMLQWLHLSETNWLSLYRAFLPSCTVAIYNVLAVIIGALFLKESNQRARPLYTMFPAGVAGKVRPLLHLVQPKLPSDSAVRVVVADDKSKAVTTRQQGDVEAQATDDTLTPSSLSKPSSVPVAAAGAGDGGAAKLPPFGFKHAFTNPLTRDVCIVSMLICGSDMLFAEILPLWCIADVESGGLGLLSAKVSILILVNSVPAVLSNLAFPSVVRLFRDEIVFWQTSQAMYALFSIVVPIAPYVGGSGAYWYTMAMGIVRKVWESWTFSLLTVIIAQTAPVGRVGVMYGVQQSTACIVRSIVPFVGSPMFAWSISARHVFPFNHFFLFIIATVPLLISAGYSRRVHIPDREAEGAVDGTGAADARLGERASETSLASLHDISSAPNGDDALHFSVHSFASGKEGVEVPALPLNNSFAALANSFATNLVSGLMQRSIIPIYINHDLDEEIATSESFSVSDVERTANQNNRPLSNSESAVAAHMGISPHPSQVHRFIRTLQEDKRQHCSESEAEMLPSE